MEADKYILWSVRSSGWLTRGGTYSSTRADAEVFSYADMLTRCRTHKNNWAEFGLLPIALSLLEAL